jgi:hypothetical protein
MTDNYLEMAAAQLNAANRELEKDLNHPLLTPAQKLRYQERMRLAEAYTKLAAIQADLPPGECQAITTGGAEMTADSPPGRAGQPAVTPDDGEPPGRRP